MRFYMWGRKPKKSRKKASGMLICMSGPLSTEGERLVAMVPGGLLGHLTPWPHVSPADKVRVLGSHVLCCDRCTLQGSLRSYRTGFTNSEPIIPISFSQKSIWKIEEKKKCKVDWVFLRQTLCVLCSLFCPKADASYIQVLFAQLRGEKHWTTWVGTASVTLLYSFDLTSFPHNKSSRLLSSWYSVSCPQFIVFAFPYPMHILFSL